MKKIIFWLEFPLFHLAPLIKKLSFNQSLEITVVTENPIPQWRVDMGFSAPDFGLAKKIYCPSLRIREKLVCDYSNKNCYHIFHGLRHVKNNFNCFRELIKTGAYIGLYFEPQQIAGSFISWVRQVYYRLFFLKYGSKVHYMLALGDLGSKQYIDLGMPKNKVFSFEYYYDKPEGELKRDRDNENLVFLYAGQLVKRKNIILVLKSLRFLKQQGYSNFEYRILGSGNQKKCLENFVENYNLNGNVIFFDNVPSEHLKQYYLTSDVFILASKFEGWGAVATEAMAFGLPLIISNGCASSCLVRNEEHGFVFENNSLKSLNKKLLKLASNSDKYTSDVSRRKRMVYAEHFLSGSAGSEKLIGILEEITARSNK